MFLHSSISLISSNGAHNRISMHPLVHMWVSDRSVEAEQEDWRIAASTLAMSISWKFQSFDYNFRRFLLPHTDFCLGSHNSELFTIGDGELERLEIAAKFALVYQECGRRQEAMELEEKVLEASKRTLGEETPGHPDGDEQPRDQLQRSRPKAGGHGAAGEGARGEQEDAGRGNTRTP